MRLNRGLRTTATLLLPFVRAKLLRKATDMPPSRGFRSKIYLTGWCVLSLHVGRPLKSTLRFISVSQRWAKGNLSHQEATALTAECLKRLTPTVRTDREAGELRRYLTSLGLFTATITLLPTPGVHKNCMKPADWQRECRRAIASSDITYARKLLMSKPSSNTSSVIEDYLKLWLNPPKTSQFRHCVSGPGPKNAADGGPLITELVRSEVLMPRAPDSQRAEQVMGPKGAIGYANGMTMDWLRKLDDASRHEVLKDYRELRAKKVDDWALSQLGVTKAIDIRPLYLHGSPNMIPIMTIDLLFRDSSRVYVTGTSFFVGANPYRAEYRRYLPENARLSDEFGGTGKEFERCHAISSHDQIINRALMRNLVDAGWVDGDDIFTTIISLGNPDYLAALDHYYGQTRR